jgi:ABC-2 type transport system ATP-binding protein
MLAVTTTEGRDAMLDDVRTWSAPGRGFPALAVNRLTKRFGDRVAFRDVSFEVGYGEVFGFLGPNGAGKTTTVRTLGTLIAPTSGSATVAGMPLTPENGVEIRRRIAIMPESPGLYRRLSVIENLQCFADLYESPAPRGRIDLALGAVGLADRAGDPCGALSKGLRQRVALARALLSDPEVLFLDEPTSGLDPVAAHEVHELIDELRRRGVTIFLTTQYLEEAAQLADRIAILQAGRLVAEDTPAGLRRRHGGLRLRLRLDQQGWITRPVASVDQAHELLDELVRAGAAIGELHLDEPTLEDAYLALTGTQPVMAAPAALAAART